MRRVQCYSCAYDAVQMVAPLIPMSNISRTLCEQLGILYTKIFDTECNVLYTVDENANFEAAGSLIESNHASSRCAMDFSFSYRV